MSTTIKITPCQDPTMQIVTALNSVRQNEGLPPVQVTTKNLTDQIVDDACKISEEAEAEAEEEDDFDTLDEMFLCFNNKMIEIKNKLKEEKKEQNRKLKTMLQREVVNFNKKSDLNKWEEKLKKKEEELNKRLKELKDAEKTALHKEIKRLEDENRGLRAEIKAGEEVVKKQRAYIFNLYSQLDQMKPQEETEEERVAKMLQEPEDADKETQDDNSN